MNILLWGLLSALTLQLNPNTAPPESLRLLPVGLEDARAAAESLQVPLDSVLRTLTIPEAKVQAIVAWRRIHGPFRNVYDLARIPGILPGDLARWKPHLTLHRSRQARGYLRDLESIRSRGASEESPRRSAFDYWVFRLREPLSLKRITVDQLRSLPNVSLLDAVALVRYVRRIQVRYPNQLRRIPELSTYGYFNVRPFLRVHNDTLPPLHGWFSLQTTLPNALTYAEDQLTQRLEELQGRTVDSTLQVRLRTAGWTDAEIQRLTDRLSREQRDLAALHVQPWTDVKTALTLHHTVRIGAAIHSSPFDQQGALSRGFLDWQPERYGLERLLLGDYRVALDQGLIMDNSEESRDRLFDRDQGVFGDLTASRSMGLRGMFARLGYGPLHAMLYGSLQERPTLPDRQGQPLFLYSGTFLPQIYRETALKERLVGVGMDVDLPRPFLVGSRLRFHVLDIRYDRPLSFRWEDLDIPADLEPLPGSDPSFPRQPTDHFRFYGMAFRTVKFPVSVEVEAAHQQNGGNAWAAAFRIQKPRFYWNLHLRSYDPSYFNPYMRPFQEDNRFEDTPLERPYRLLDPVAGELQTFPMPKPERGIFLETRYQFHRKFLVPRAYVDVWEDRTEGLWNYRLNLEGEFRPVHPIRIRYRERWQIRRNLRYNGISRSLSEERALRVFFLTGRGFAGVELRYSQVDLSPRTDIPRALMKGGFLSFFWNEDLTPQTRIRLGTAVWRNQGASQWIFEDTGIDFLYGDGSKIYLTMIHALRPNLLLRFKLRQKTTRFSHNVPLEEAYHYSDGRLFAGSWVDRDPAWTLTLNLDYLF